jgi:hypothetical protein
LFGARSALARRSDPSGMATRQRRTAGLVNGWHSKPPEAARGQAERH